MKRCPKCGAACSRPGQKFCSQCGAPLSQTPPQAASWPPEAVVQRKRLIAVAVGVVVVVLLAIAGLVTLLGRGDTQPTSRRNRPPRWPIPNACIWKTCWWWTA